MGGWVGVGEHAGMRLAFRIGSGPGLVSSNQGMQFEVPYRDDQ